ncbi:m2 [Drosophila simulans]|uniref:M2 n=1 Tax=Drosophila simulans TaxID=7240 RepID=B4QW10_DROSI|nr:m2 [Drosophila simulans]
MVIEASRRAAQKTRWEGGIPIPGGGQGSVVAGPNHRLMVFTHLLLTAPSIDLAKTNRPGQSMTAKRMLVTHAKAAPLVIENWVAMVALAKVIAITLGSWPTWLAAISPKCEHITPSGHNGHKTRLATRLSILGQSYLRN